MNILIWLTSSVFLFNFGALFLQCIKFQQIINTILPSLPYYYVLLLFGYFGIGVLFHSTFGVANDPITASLLYMQQSRLDITTRDIYLQKGGIVAVLLSYFILSVLLLNLPLAYIM